MLPLCKHIFIIILLYIFFDIEKDGYDVGSRVICEIPKMGIKGRINVVYRLFIWDINTSTN